MNDSIFHQIQECTQYLNLELPAQEIANLSVEQEFSEECIEAWNNYRDQSSYLCG